MFLGPFGVNLLVFLVFSSFEAIKAKKAARVARTTIFCSGMSNDPKLLSYYSWATFILPKRWIRVSRVQTSFLKAKRPTICQKIEELKKLSKVKVGVFRIMYQRHFEQFFQFLNFLSCGWPFGLQDTCLQSWRSKWPFW